MTRRGVLVVCVLAGLGVCGGIACADGVFANGAAVAGGQVVPLYGDSGCISAQCSRDCIYNNYTYLCATTATFRRYDDQMNGLPLRVTAIADCVVVTPFGPATCYKSKSASGSGQVTAQATCYVSTIWAGSNWNEGDCLCEEL
jgi:hypothetical protein